MVRVIVLSERDGGSFFNELKQDPGAPDFAEAEDAADLRAVPLGSAARQVVLRELAGCHAHLVAEVLDGGSHQDAVAVLARRCSTGVTR
jgi:hypothetical protein